MLFQRGIHSVNVSPYKYMKDVLSNPLLTSKVLLYKNIQIIKNTVLLHSNSFLHLRKAIFGSIYSLTWNADGISCRVLDILSIAKMLF